MGAGAGSVVGAGDSYDDAGTGAGTGAGSHHFIVTT